MTKSSKLNTILRLSLAAALAGGCAAEGHEPSPPPDRAPVEAETSPGDVANGTLSESDSTGDGQVPPGAEPTEAPRARVVTLTLSMRVENLLAASDALRRLATTHDGYVQDATVDTERGSVHLKIPAANVAEARAELRRLGEITSEQEQVEDVTAQRADLGARLRNAGAHEVRLLHIVSENTASLEDLLASERELSRVRETIERLEAQSRTLEGRIAYANVHVSLREPPPAAVAETSFLDHPLDAIAGGLEMGLHATWAVFVGAAVVVATLAPASGLLALLLLLAYAVGSWMRARRRTAPTLS